MTDALYNARILELAGNISHIGRLDAPQATAEATSRMCGSHVRVELSLDESGCVSDFAHEVEACALGQATSAVMAREIVGSTPEDLRLVGAAMRAMLKADGAPPDGRWRDLALLRPVRDYPPRHASTLLTFDAVEDCLKQLGA